MKRLTAENIYTGGADGRKSIDCKCSAWWVREAAEKSYRQFGTYCAAIDKLLESFMYVVNDRGTSIVTWNDVHMGPGKEAEIADTLNKVFENAGLVLT